MSQAKTVEERFFEKVDDGREDGCWEWQAATNNHGYGTLRIDGDVFLAHRLSVLLDRDDMGIDDVDELNVVMHSCDNPSCVNARHLSTGDLSENMQDAASKGRCYGQKLCEDDVREIRERYDCNDVTQCELADEFDVSQRHVSRIVNHQTFEFVK